MVRSNVHTSGPRAVDAAGDLAEHHWRVIDMGKGIEPNRGDKHGRLTFVAETDRAGRRLRYGWFICDCGGERELSLSFWRREVVRSCGCLAEETRKSAPRTHGGTGTPLHSAWKYMRLRTNGRTAGYENVRCDPRWATFDGFRLHQPGGRGFEPGLVLARNGDVGDYAPENCRWATKSENSREASERSMHRLPDGRFALDVARQNGISESTFWLRMARSWAPERAATEPPHFRGQVAK